MPAFPSRPRARLLAAAIGAVPLAIGGGAIAVATTPPSPTPSLAPLPTITPTPQPQNDQLLCADPAPDQAGRPARLTAVTEGSSVVLEWQVRSGEVYNGPCLYVPARWAVYEGSTRLGFVNSGYSFGGEYRIADATLGEHTYRVESVNNASQWAPKTVKVSVTGATPTPTPSPAVDPTPFFPTLTPTPSPSPKPTPQTQQECRVATAENANRPAHLSAKPSVDGKSLKLTWTAPTGPAGSTLCLNIPTLWSIFDKGGSRGDVLGGFESTFTLTGSEPGKEHDIWVIPGNNDNLGILARQFAMAADTCGGTIPSGTFEIDDPATYTDNDTKYTHVTWSRPSRDCGLDISEYTLSLDGAYVSRTDANQGEFGLLEGLEPGSSHTVTVNAVDVGGNVVGTARRMFVVPGAATPTPTPTPLPPTPNPSTSSLAARGALALRGQGLVGNYALRGTVSLVGPLGSGAVTGRLPSFETTGNLLVAGVLPIKATIVASGGPVWGSKTSTTADLATLQTLTIKKAAILGLTLTSGGTCKTAELTIPLKSTRAFDLIAGGQLSGQFAPGDFTGCGLLNYYVSNKAARSSLTLNLAPVPAATR